MANGKNKKRHALMDEAMSAWYDEIEAEYDYYYGDEVEDEETGSDGPIGADGDTPKGATLGDFIKGPSKKEIAAWQGILDTLLKAVPRAPVAGALIEGAVESDLAEVFSQASDLLGDLEPVPTAESDPFAVSVLQGFKSRLDVITSGLETARAAIGDRERKRKKHLDEIAGVDLPEGHEKDEESAFNDLVRTARSHAGKTPLEEEAITLAIGALKDKAKEIAEAVEERKEENKRLDGLYRSVETVDCMPHQDVERAGLKEAIERALEPPITAERNKAAKTLVEAYVKWEARIKAEMAALGGPAAAKELCSELGFAADKIADLIATFGGPEAVKDAVAATGSAENLGKLTKAGLDPKDVKTMGDGLGAGFLQEMIAFDPGKVVELKKKLGGNLKDVAKTAKETGLDDKPKALLALFKTGCKGDAGAFNKLLFTDFADSGAQADLKGIITDGGLGNAPEALGALMATGCNGKGSALKSLAKEMKGADARKGLANMLAEGNLKGEDPVKPDCLAVLLQHSVDTPVLPDMSSDQAKGFAKLCAAMKSGKGAENLGKMLTTGGMGSDPKVLGPLLSTGCKGDAAAFNKLTDGIKGNLAALDKLLKDGGFGSQDRGGDDTGIKPECLGTLLGAGCDGKPAELNRLLGAMNDNRYLAAMKGVMVAGDLGDHPKVLGEMYRVGCLQAPQGGEDGRKNPDVLISMLAKFRDADGPAAFKSLLDDGGFGEPGKEHRLGTTLRYGFTGKPGHAPPNYTNKQSAGKLRDLHDAFSGDMTRLENMIDALDSPCPGVLPQGTDKQPGVGLQNLYNAPGIQGDVSKFESKVVAGMEARAVHSSFSKEELLQNAASFEFERVPRNRRTMRANVNAGAGAAVNQSVRMDHIAERHSRTYSDLEPSANALTAPTSLFPEGTSLDDIRNAVQTAARNAPAPRRRTDFPAIMRRGVQRTDRHGTPLHETYVAFNPVADGRPGGGTAKIGFGYAGGRVKIVQFLPKGGTHVVKLNYRDLAAMKTALK